MRHTLRTGGVHHGVDASTVVDGSKTARTNKTNFVRGSVSSLAPTAVGRSFAQGVPGLRGTINKEVFFRSLGKGKPCGQVVAAHTGREAYATGRMHRPLSMGRKQRARINQTNEYGTVRRLPMRSEVAWRGDNGLPHSTTGRVTLRNEAGQSGGSRGGPRERCAAAGHAAGGQTHRFVPTDVSLAPAACGRDLSWVDAGTRMTRAPSLHSQAWRPTPPRNLPLQFVAERFTTQT